jgi:multiple sugar transport system permease protein
MVVGSLGRARALLGLRFTVVTLGAAVMAVPFLYMLATSFKPNAYVLEMTPHFVPQHPTVSNYTSAWSSNDFGRYFFNSLVVAVATTFFALWLSSMMAYAFARFRFPLRGLLFGLVLLGLMVPTMMLLIPQFLLAKQLGALNSLWGLVFFYTGGNVAFNAFLLTGFFQDVPSELEEAMVVDGASPWSRYVRLILPLSRPALATVAIFTFLASWDEYVWALTVINDPGKRTLPIAIALFQGQHSTSWGLVFAASAIAVGPVLLLYAAFQKQFIGNLTVGAVKA